MDQNFRKGSANLTPSGANTGQEATVRSRGTFGFVLVFLFLTFEYARPQDQIAVIGMLRPGVIFALLMTAAALASGRMPAAVCPQTKGIFLLLVLMVLHVPLALNNFRAYQVTQGFLLLMPAVIAIILFVDSLDRLRMLVKYLSFLALYISVKGILGSGVAGSAFLADENDFSLLMNVMLPFALCLSVYEQNRMKKFIYLAISLSCVISVVISSSRGGFVGLLAVMLVLWLGSPRKLLFLGVAGVLVAAMYIVADQKYWDDMATIQNTEESTAKERLDSWSAAWEMFKDHPLGVGPGNFPMKFPEYQPDSMRRNMWGRQAHSLWFTLLPELGVLGVLFYIFILQNNLKDLRGIRKIEGGDNERKYFALLSLAFSASLAGYFASGFFLSVLYYPHYWYLTAMIVAAKRVGRSQGGRLPSQAVRAA